MSSLTLLSAYGGDSSDDDVPGSRVSTKRCLKEEEREPSKQIRYALPSVSSFSSLSLLSAYGGDSSDDDVPGSRVSTKRCLKEDEREPSKHIRLPAPSFILPKEVVLEENHLDDPSQHNGRLRSFQHERGNWATHVYIPVTTQNSEKLQELFDYFKLNHVEELNQIGLESMDEHHISLSKTVVLRHHHIKIFVDSLKENLSHFTKCLLLFDQLNVYCNEEKTRTFLSIDIRTGMDTLNRLIEAVNISLKEFGLPLFYEDPSFHISIGWCLGDRKEELKSKLDILENSFSTYCQKFLQEDWFIYVTHIECKIGNKLYQFQLN